MFMVQTEFSLKNKVALVTGGSRGIGRATALGFARAGADVIVASRKTADLEQVAGEIRALGRKSMTVAAHIGHHDEIQPMVQKIVAEFGRIDILVNNAGVGIVWAPALELEERAWDVTMNLNLKGLFFLSQAVARVMKENGGGSIINLSSVDGQRAEVNNSVYCISKAGVIMTTKSLAKEWAKHNIRVNCVAPGFITTRLMDSRWEVDPENKPEIVSRILLHGLGEPDFLVGTMIYLASDASAYVTGETITVDGGYMLT
jgi:NAD(P)-dependent dehydrogenase (short-subunit alcohol dehydrogenase family)